MKLTKESIGKIYKLIYPLSRKKNRVAGMFRITSKQGGRFSGEVKEYLVGKLEDNWGWSRAVFNVDGKAINEKGVKIINGYCLEKL